MQNNTPGKMILPKSEDQLQAECFQWRKVNGMYYIW